MNKAPSIYHFWKKKVLFPLLIGLSLLLMSVIATSLSFNHQESLRSTHLIANTIAAALKNPLLIGDDLSIISLVSRIGREEGLFISITDSKQNIIAQHNPHKIGKIPDVDTLTETIINNNGEVLGFLIIEKTSFNLGVGNYLFLFITTTLILTLMLVTSFKRFRFIFNDISSSLLDKTKEPYFLELGETKRKLEENTALFLEKEKLSLHYKIGQQVAHDIRSPLTALDIGISRLTGIDETKKSLITNAYTRINEIIENLLINEQQSEEQAPPVIPVAIVVNEILEEKKLEFSDKNNITIAGIFNKDALNAFAKVPSAELKRIISNLINNSVEAINDVGRVNIGVSVAKEKIFIRIEDTGKGIPDFILRKLGQVSVSYGKNGQNSGMGIGFLNAKQVITSWGGDIKIKSSPGKGTCITLCLPRTEKPLWYCSELDLRQINRLVIVEDDPSIQEFWRKQLLDLSMENLSSPSHFKRWIANNSPEDVFFIFDHNFKGYNENGIDLIREYNLTKQSLLITSMMDEPEVIKRCLKLHINGFPKKSLKQLKIQRPKASPSPQPQYSRDSFEHIAPALDQS